MAEENIFLKALNFISPANWWEAVVGAATGKSDDLKDVTNPSFEQRIGSVASNSQALSGLATGFEAATSLPVIGEPLKFALDLPNRSFDAFATGLQRADYEDDFFGGFSNGWVRSWDSWGQEGHLSGGQIIGAKLNDGDAVSGTDIFTKQGVAEIDASAKQTWYGNIAGGVSDLMAGFIGPETALVPALRASRAARGADLAIDQAESTARVFNEAAQSGTLGALKKRAGSSFVNGLTGAPISGESYAARLRDFARDAVEASPDMASAMNFFGPRMARATEGSKRIMAETAVLANRMGSDAGTTLLGNAWLGLLGSERAIEEVKALSPLAMAKITNATDVPQDLAVIAAGQEKLLEAYRSNKFEGVARVMDEVFETPRKQGEYAALRSEWERATEDAVRARELRARVTASKPEFRYKDNNGNFVDNFDTARLKESRAKAATQVQAIKDELKSTKDRLRTLKRERGGINEQAKLSRRKTDRGEMPDSAEADFMARESGSALTRVTETEAKIKELEASLAEAQSDLDLLKSTPLNDPDAMAKWKSSMTASKMSAKQAQRKADILKAMERSVARELRSDLETARRISPTLNASNLWLTDVMAISSGSETVVGGVASTRLQKMKTRFRERVGQTYMFDTGDYTPRVFFHRAAKDTVASIGTAYGRRAVNTHDLYKGAQELPMYLKKSGVFQGDEIRDLTNRFLEAPSQKARNELISRAGDVMTERMLLKAGFDPRQIPGHLRLMHQGMDGQRSYLTGRLAKAEEAGEKWVKTNALPDLDGGTAIDMHDTAFLRSHLSDTVAFPDPSDVKRFIHEFKSGQRLRRGLDVTLGAGDEFNYWWKVAQLARPGLFFRNMIDTGIRAQMLMGTMEYALSGMRGGFHAVRNTGVRVGDWTRRSTKGTALERHGARLGPETIAKHYLGDTGVTIDIGGGKTQKLAFYDLIDGHASATSIAAIRGAATRGASMGEGIMGSGLPVYDRLVKNHAKWDKYKATAPDAQWVHAYKDHAEALLASPTARKVIEMEATKLDETLDVPDLVDELFSDGKVVDEYNRAAAIENMSREQWVEQILWETDNMFPEPGMAEAVMSGRLRGRAADEWVQEHFPVELRFDLPGKESRLGEARTERAIYRERVGGFMDKMFKTLIDQPDYWLVRHPVMVESYAKRLKYEAGRLLEARRKKFGDEAILTEKDIATLDRRARAHAVGQVKEFMYDNTYSNGVGWLHRVAPFFNPWYDAMRAYSKLVADNPQRLRSLLGIWNSPENLNQWVDAMNGDAGALIVDGDGNPVRPGQDEEDDDGQRFIVINSLLGKPAPLGGGVKLRKDSFNTLLMGEIPWLPGWGPTVTVPLAKAIGSNQDVALWLADNDNVMVQTFMKSLWPDGQVPESDFESLVNSITPATWRKVNDVWRGGRTYWTNVQYSLNEQAIRAQRNGEEFDPKAAAKEAERQATSAGWWSVVSQGIFGISAKSDVDGEFYAARMRELQSLDPAVLKAEGYPSAQAKFIADFPEAANLTWSFSRNETGIQATVKAQSYANELRPLIEGMPDMGWFIVGSENVGGEFSHTAYNQQKQYTYGITDKGRKVLEPGEVMENTLSGIGWDEYTRVADQIDRLGEQYGFKRETLSTLKRKFATQIGEKYPEWFKDYNTRVERLPIFFAQADKLAQDPRLAGRQDIGMYQEYRAMREQVLRIVGLKSLTGTSAKSEAARAALYQIGQQLSERSPGFAQMWERVLVNEVEPKGVVDGGNG